MEDFRVRVGFLNNFKTKMLRKKHGADAVLGLIQLWAYCASTPERTTGDLGGLSDEMIAAIAEVDLACVSTFCELGLIDGKKKKRKVHDWERHNPYVNSHKERSERAREAANTRWKKGNKKCSSNAKRMPEHAPSMPVASGSNADSMPDACPISISIPNSISNSISISPDSYSDLSTQEIQGLCSPKGFGMMQNRDLILVTQLAPITYEELDRAIVITLEKTDHPSYGYMLKVLRSGRDNDRDPDGMTLEERKAFVMKQTAEFEAPLVGMDLDL